MITPKPYAYVGPEHVRAAAAASGLGAPIGAVADLAAWLRANASEREGSSIVATFVVGLDGVLRIASRRSEHVACAGGGRVLAAGEMFFAADAPPRVVAVTNLSTGYCPEPESWPAVSAALDRAGVQHPGRFTDAFVFRRCTSCAERNVVKDSYFVCAVCDAELPAHWNFADRA